MSIALDVQVKLPFGYDGFSMPADVALAQIPPELTCSSRQGQPMRHPRGAYNASMSQVIRRGLRVIEGVTNLPSEDSARRMAVRDALDRQDAFLDALFEHVEDCELIVGNLQALAGPIQIMKPWKKAVEPFHDHLGRVVNHIKHSQGRLRPVEMADEHCRIVGYFVEGVCVEGVVGPHVGLHRGGHTAFSFARDLRRHAVGLFGVSIALAASVGTYLNNGQSFAAESNPKSNDIARFFDAVASLPTDVFPDEALLDQWPAVSFSRRHGHSTRVLRLTFPSATQKPRFLKGGRTNAELEGDVTSKKFRTPYLGKEFWEDLVRKVPARL